MWYPRSFVSRLALSVVGVFGLIQVLLCGFILLVREGEVRRDFDERIELRASAAIDAVEASYLRSGQLTLAQRAASPTSGLALAGTYWQVRDADGVVIERSPSLGTATLPPPGDRDPHAGDPQPVTWRSDEVTALLGRPGALRIVSHASDIEGEAPFIVQVARDLEPVTTAIASLRRTLLLSVLFGLLLTGIAGWLLARRVRRGLSSIGLQAELITLDDTRRRIEHAGGDSELRQLAASLNAMLDGLERAMRTREQFLADVSHELKAPLTALAADARMMAAASRTSDVCRQLDSAVQSVVGSITGAADALLMLAKCPEGSVESGAGPVALNEVVTDAVAHCLPLARPRAVRLVPMLAEQQDLLVAGHADLLRVMIENLVRNAVDHSPDGEPVHVLVRASDLAATITVTDNGPGVAPDLLPRVFERNFSTRRPGSGRPGHGLGLAIARRVAEVHGGSIDLSNRPAGGCEVVIRLPLHAEVPAE